MTIQSPKTSISIAKTNVLLLLPWRTIRTTWLLSVWAGQASVCLHTMVILQADLLTEQDEGPGQNPTPAWMVNHENSHWGDTFSWSLQGVWQICGVSLFPRRLWLWGPDASGVSEGRPLWGKQLTPHHTVSASLQCSQGTVLPTLPPQVLRKKIRVLQPVFHSLKFSSIRLFLLV